MGYYHEIVEYLGTRDARFTVYGTVLGIFVLYLIRVVYRAFVIWKKLLIEGKSTFIQPFLDMDALSLSSVSALATFSVG